MDSRAPRSEAGSRRELRPTDDGWRADALAGSRHSRLGPDLREPLDDPDPNRAQTLCADVCRDLLGDYAPALTLLPSTDRRRFQAAVAYARTLLDFALEHGFEGEKLARINRWEFELERALDGEALDQPVFLAMAALEKRSPWDRPALAELSRIARSLAASAVESRVRAAGEAVATSLLAAATGLQPSPSLADHLASIVAFEVDRPKGTMSGASPPSGVLDAGELSRPWRRALRYASLAAHARAGAPGAARLGPITRVRLLLRSLLEH